MDDSVTLAPVKSPFLSKTNITGFLLALFGVLGLFGVLPDTFDANNVVNTIITVGGTLVMLFRTYSGSVLKFGTITE